VGGPVIGNSDVFLLKYDGSGDLLWGQQLGTSRLDMAWALDVDDAGCAYISGESDGDFGGTNPYYHKAPFVCKCDQSGDLVWASMLANDAYCTGVAVDSEGNSYITGYTERNLLGPRIGAWDVYICKHDVTGDLIWGAQLGTTDWEKSFAVAVGEDNTAYLTGWTAGDLGGQHVGEGDVFLISIPEPATVSLLAVGAVGLLLRRRKRRGRAEA
jgi:hypothetical protein